MPIPRMKLTRRSKKLYFSFGYLIFFVLLVLGIIFFMSDNSMDMLDELHHPASLPQTYHNADSRYIVYYPENWQYEKISDGTVIFNGLPGTPAETTAINIQTVLTKNLGGNFQTVKQFIADIKHQVMMQSPDATFQENGPISITEKGGLIDQGEYVTFTYHYQKMTYKQWQVVLLRHDQQVFYAWAYTVPKAQYQENYPIAKQMFESWVIY